MALNYSTAVKNTRLTAVVTAVDAAASFGKINLYTTAYGTLLATFTLSKPSAVVSGGILTLAGVPKATTGLAAGVAALAKILDSVDTVIADGLTVGTGSFDINIDNTNIAIGQTVNLNSGAITHG